MASFSFSLRNRITQSAHFDFVFKRGKSASNSIAKVIGSPSMLDEPRIGIIAGKRVGNAVKRNLAKRQLREFIRHHWPLLDANCDYVFVAHSDIISTPHPIINSHLEKLVGRIN